MGSTSQGLLVELEDPYLEDEYVGPPESYKTQQDVSQSRDKTPTSSKQVSKFKRVPAVEDPKPMNARAIVYTPKDISQESASKPTSKTRSSITSRATIPRNPAPVVRQSLAYSHPPPPTQPPESFFSPPRLPLPPPPPQPSTFSNLPPQAAQQQISDIQNPLSIMNQFLGQPARDLLLNAARLANPNVVNDIGQGSYPFHLSNQTSAPQSGSSLQDIFAAPLAHNSNSFNHSFGHPPLFTSSNNLTSNNFNLNNLNNPPTSSNNCTSTSFEIPIINHSDPLDILKNFPSDILERITSSTNNINNNISNSSAFNPDFGNYEAWKRNHPPQPPLLPPPTEDDMAEQDLEADADKDEEYHEVETYADYSPAKLSIGCPHPDPVVETSSLSTVQPPDINYRLSLPSKVIDDGLLSALQLESVIYASQQHCQLLPDQETRKGFLIGDGAGVGKGRTIAGIIYENYLCGRKKSIWLSVSTDLKLDAERDLSDIGAKIPVFLLNKVQYGRRVDESKGVLFTTYSGLVSKSHSVKGPLGSRLGQIINWVGPDFDGCIVFDECHKAKNIVIEKKKSTSSKAAMFAVDIQNKLPNARIVYASATGASEPKHLGYMTRLGIWGQGTPYECFGNFCTAIEKRGVGAMELVAVELKMRGTYIARQLSFKTTSFEIKTATLTPDFIKVYDQCVEMWSKALNYFNEAIFLSPEMKDKKRSRTVWSMFWAAHQKFFKYLCVGAKVPLVVQITKEALEADKCVVIGLQTTGEAKTNEALMDGEICEFVSTARATFESLVENYFPAPDVPIQRKVDKQKFSVPKSKCDKSPSRSSNSSEPSTSSGSTIVDETYHSHVGLKFTRDQHGVKVQPEDEEVSCTEDSKGKESIKIRQNKYLSALQALADEKKAAAGNTARAQRAKRRATARRYRKSRIRKLDDSSDTDLSNLLSSSSNEASENTQDADYSEESEASYSTDESCSTLVEEYESDDDVSIVASKRRKGGSLSKPKKNVLDSASEDSDVQVTAIKPRNHDVIILDDDEDDENFEDATKSHYPWEIQTIKMKKELLDMIDDIGPKLPNNTLDDLIDQLGGPDKVAEMTGRKGRIVKDEDGSIGYRNRNEVDALDVMNLAEKERFMSGQKLVAIISEAASSGISLQADRRVENKRRRVHITIELPWSADRAIQQFGRTHRSNQVSGPEYVFVISELAGEKRFASIVANRLESLGALTHGDRRATAESRDFSQFNILNRYSRQAVENISNHIALGAPNMMRHLKPNYDGDFFEDARLAYIDCGLGKRSHGTSLELIVNIAGLKTDTFLNRLLGMKVAIQNAIFQYFVDHMDRLIKRKKIQGLFDAGILELNSESGKTRCAEPEDFVLKTLGGPVRCTLRSVRVERGITWEEAMSLYNDAIVEDSRSGYYKSVNPMTGAELVYLLIREPETVDMFREYKPNIGRGAKAYYYSILSDKGDKVEPDQVKSLWRHVYEATDTRCVHLCYFNSCKRIEAKMKCDIGLRHRNYTILSGGILTAWPYLEQKLPAATQRIQIIRLRLDANNRVIGPIIPQEHLEKVRKVLRQGEIVPIF